MSDFVPPIDIEVLLRPISDEAPTGEYLRYEGTYDRIQEARREDDPNLPQGVWKTTLKRATWSDVQRLCRDALTTRTKDLQIAVWLTEAWTVQQGLRGAVFGIKLLHGLCRDFWEHLYPAIDGDDLSFRLGPIDWLEQRLPLRLKAIPITKPSGDAPQYTYADLELAIHREKEGRREREDSTEGQPIEEDPKTPTQARFHASAALTPRPFFQGILGELKELSAALDALDAILTEKAGSGAISLRLLREVVTQLRVNIQQATGNTDGREEHDAGAEEHDHGDGGDAEAADQGLSNGGGGGGRGAGGPIRSRAQAYQRLIEAADYLLRTEPHSPTPYLVKRAVAWGSMSLTDLLSEIVNSPGDLQAIFSLLGIRGRQDRGDRGE